MARWKGVEREVAKLFGGKRRGADFGGVEGGKSDIILDGWSIEVKHYKSPHWSMMVKAYHQAVDAMENADDIPIAVIHKKGTAVKKSLVVMELDKFIEFFGGSE